MYGKHFTKLPYTPSCPTGSYPTASYPTGAHRFSAARNSSPRAARHRACRGLGLVWGEAWAWFAQRVATSIALPRLPWCGTGAVLVWYWCGTGAVPVRHWRGTGAGEFQEQRGLSARSYPSRALLAHIYVQACTYLSEQGAALTMCTVHADVTEPVAVWPIYMYRRDMWPIYVYVDVRACRCLALNMRRSSLLIAWNHGHLQWHLPQVHSGSPKRTRV